MTTQAEGREPLDVLAEEFLDRYRRGERPALSEFAARHPVLAEKIHELFPTLVELEQVGSSSCTHPTQPAGFQCPDRLGDFCIIREISRGGMGIVYEAEQESLGRRVALKVFPFHALLDPKHLARFQREARAAAQLHHSHIVPVFGVGQCEGLYYYAMQFIDGQSLDVVLRGVAELAPAAAADTKAQAKSSTDHDLSLSSSLSGLKRNEYYRRVARLALQAAEGLAYAHAQGIVHRDIKPSNLLLDKAGDIWITDFGLAKHEGPSELTQSGDVIGTLRYMAPEQLQGWADPRTDIHGLGLTLYELVALRPVNDASSRGELIKHIADRTPAPLSRFDRQVPRDLETIVGKMIAKEPAERYASAADAVSDLTRFLADQPILARRSSASERLWRTCRKHPAVASLTVMVCILLAVIAGISAATSWRVQASLTAVSRAQRERTDQLWKAKLNEALSLHHTGRVGHRTEAWQRLTEAAELEREVGAGEKARRDLRNAAISTLALTDLRYVGPGPAESPGVTILGFDPTITKYLRADGLGNMSVRRVADDQEVASLPATGPGQEKWRWVGGPRFSADGRLLAVAYFAHEFGIQPGQVVAWNVERQEIAFVAPAQSWQYAYDLSRDGRSLVIGQRDGVAIVYDVASGNESARVKLPQVALGVRFNPQANRLATSNYADGSDVLVIDLPTGVVLHRFRQEHGGEIGWHPGGKLLAVTGRDFLVHVWNLTTGREQCVLRGHQAIPHDPAFTPDGEILVTGTYDGTVRLWHAWNGIELVRCPGTMGSLISIDGQRLAVRQGSQFAFFDIQRSAEYRTLPLTAANALDRFEWSAAPQHPRQPWLPVKGTDGIRLLDLDTGRELAAAQVGSTNAVVWSPQGNEMYSVGRTGLYRWPIGERDGAASIGPPQRIGPPGDSIAINPTGEELAVGSMSATAYRLELHSAGASPRHISHRMATTTHYSADGKWFVAGTHHGRGIKVWALDQDQALPLLLPDVSRTYPVFSPDSQFLAANRSGLVQLWHVGDWRPIRSLATVSGHFPGFVFSPDSRLLAWTRTPYQICLEDVATGNELAMLEAPDDLQTSGMLFSSDGSRLIVSTSYPPTLRVWDLARVRERLASLKLADDLPNWQRASASLPFKHVAFDEGLTARQLQARAEEYRNRRQYEAACADLEAILEKEPDNAGILNRLAWLRCIGPSSVRDVVKAERLIRRAFDLTPENAYYHNTLALLDYRRGRFAEAAEAIGKSQELVGAGQSNQLTALWGFERALTQHQSGRKDEARRTFDEANRWLTANRTKLPNPHLFEAESLQAEAAVLLGIDQE